MPRRKELFPLGIAGEMTRYPDSAKGIKEDVLSYHLMIPVIVGGGY